MKFFKEDRKWSPVEEASVFSFYLICRPAPRPNCQTISRRSSRRWQCSIIGPAPVRIEFGYLNLETLNVTFAPKAGGSNLPVSSTGQARTLQISEDSIRIIGRWAQDPRSGETVFTVRVESRNDPVGLFPTIDVPVLAATFGFGPALLTATDPPETGTALFVASGFLTERLPGLSQPVIPRGKITIRAIQAGDDRVYLENFHCSPVPTFTQQINRSFSHIDIFIIPGNPVNEHLSYFTTPMEYGAQHYEGASI